MLAQEYGRLRDRQMNASALHCGERLDGFGKLALQSSLVIHLFLELGRSEFLVVDELESHRPTFGQSLRSQAQTRVMHL